MKKHQKDFYRQKNNCIQGGRGEFAKLRVSRVFAPHVPSCITCPRDSRAFAHSCLTCVCALRAFVPYVPYLRFLRVFFTPLTDLVCASLNLFRMFLQSSSNVPFSKDYERHCKPCCFYAGQKTAVILFKQGNLSIFKT